MRSKLAATALISASIIAFGVLASAQQPKYGVTVRTSDKSRLEKAKIYSWTRSQPSADATIDRQITAAVDKELAARGLTKGTSGPNDLVATYASMTRTDVDLKAKTADGQRPEYPVGTLLVELRDPASQKAAFSVRLDTPLSGDRAKLEPEINAAVAAMFEKYPIAAKK